MNSNEEYLDELLKSIEPITNPEGIDDENDAEIPADTSNEVEIDSNSFEASVSTLEESDQAPKEPNQTQEEELPNDIGDLIDNDSENSVKETEQENHLNMSEDEINALLNDVKNSTVGEKTEDSTDVKELLKQFDEDEDLTDIHNILEKNDNDEAVDTKITDENLEDIVIPESILADEANETNEDIADENENLDESVKKQKKEKKQKTVKEKKQKTVKEKKENLFTKVFNMLTEEEEETEEKKGKKEETKVLDDLSLIPEKNETGITDENLQILDELSKEDKKKNKKLKKKGKDKKKGTPTDEETEESDDQVKGKNKKQKKEKKDRKQKTHVQTKPEKKLPKKRVISTFALCFTILALILIMSFVLEEHNNIKDASWAFDNEDYETCYENLYGLNLNEENQSMYNKSETILVLRRKLSSYENYKRLGMDVEALNALFEGVRMYPQIQAKAQEYNVVEKVDSIYNSIMAKFDEYGLTQDDVNEILAYESKVKYTKRLQSIIDGTPFVYEDDVAQQQEQTIDDILPEEEDFLPEDPNSIFEDNSETVTTEDSSATEQDTEINNEVNSEQNVQDDQPVRVGSNSANQGTRVTNGNMNLSSEIEDGSVVIDNDNSND